MARPTTGSLPTMTMVIGVEAFRRIDGAMGRSELTGDSVVWFGSSPPGTRLLSSFSSTPSCPGIAVCLCTREPRLAGYPAVNCTLIVSTGITVLSGGSQHIYQVVHISLTLGICRLVEGDAQPPVRLSFSSPMGLDSVRRSRAKA